MQDLGFRVSIVLGVEFGGLIFCMQGCGLGCRVLLTVRGLQRVYIVHLNIIVRSPYTPYSIYVIKGDPKPWNLNGSFLFLFMYPNITPI